MHFFKSYILLEYQIQIHGYKPNTYNSLGKAKREPFYFLRATAGGKITTLPPQNQIDLEGLRPTGDLSKFLYHYLYC